MEYTQLGRSGLSVSRFCLGTLPFGSRVSEPDSGLIMDRALELGINFFDTSNIYGLQEGADWTENVIGRWFAQGGGRREKTVLASKVYQPQSEWPNHSRLSALHIRQACDDSLRRLQTDHIDLYQMHHIDRLTPWDEIWEAMETLRAQGKILYVGSSNFAGWHLAQAQEAAKARHFFGLVSEQSKYSLLTRDIERELLPAARAYGIGVLVWSPLERGMLGGLLAAEAGGKKRNERVHSDVLEAVRPQLERFEALCRRIGEAPAHVALAWIAAQSGITGSIIGPSSVPQLDDTIRSLDVVLDAALLAELNEIFPGYLTAPEDYAW